jgi:broad specificity phosphatase PhoE
LVTKLKIFTEAEKKALKVDPSAESVDELLARFITFLREVSVANLNKKVLIVTHGGAMRNFLIHSAWAKDEELPPYSLSNCAYLIVESDGVDFFIKKAVGVNKKEIK